MLFVQKGIFAVEMELPLVKSPFQICFKRLVSDCNEVQPMFDYFAPLNILSPSVHWDWKQPCIIWYRQCKCTPMPDRPSYFVKVALFCLFFKGIDLFLCIPLFTQEVNAILDLKPCFQNIFHHWSTLIYVLNRSNWIWLLFPPHKCCP